MSRLHDHLSLRSLKLLAAIEAAGSLSRAAAQLHIVPSAASRRISLLEASLGFVLLERTSRGVELNAAGRALARSAHRMLDEVARLEDELADLQGGITGHVTLLASISAIVQHLPQDLARFAQSHPQIRVDLQEERSAAIVDALLAGRADMGIMVVSGPVPGLAVLPYRSERLAVILPSGHRLARRRSLRFVDLLDEDWIGLPPGTALASLLERQADLQGARLRVRIQVHGMDSACRMVQSGLGIGLLPQASLGQQAQFPGLVSVRLAETWAERTSVIAVHDKTPPTPAAALLMAALGEAP